MTNDELQTRVEAIDIEREMQDSFLEYAMSVIAPPDTGTNTARPHNNTSNISLALLDR